MDIQLAKSLYDEGFPLKPASLEDVHDSKRKYEIFRYGKDSIGRDGAWLFPTLTELLDACPEDGTQLIKGIGKTYYAEFIDHSVMPYRRTHLAQAVSPEEAVSFLWLLLNERKKNKENKENKK